MVACELVSEPPAGARKGGLAPHCLRRVFAYIDEHLDEELRLRTLARVAGLSEGRFAHNFKAATGSSPHRFVIRVRIERAKRMLDETDMTVVTVAHALGFGSASRFALLFRRATGVTPTAYRASSRSQSALRSHEVTRSG